MIFLRNTEALQQYLTMQPSFLGLVIRSHFIHDSTSFLSVPFDRLVATMRRLTINGYKHVNGTWQYSNVDKALDMPTVCVDKCYGKHH